MSCPKCGFPRQPESNECPKCGIIYDKYGKKTKSRQAEDVRKVRDEEKRAKKASVKLFLKQLSIKKNISQLTSYQKAALVLLAVLIIIGIGFMIFRPDITVNGEVFITEKGDGKISLDMAEVNVFPLDTLLPYLVERKKDRYDQLLTVLKKIEAAKNEYDKALQNLENVFRWDFDNIDKAIKIREAAERKWLKLRAEEEEIASCGFFFQKLPVPLLSAKTNSDGKFDLLIPPSGLHAITVSAGRHVPDNDEKYYWITIIDPENGSQQRAVLSDDTLLSVDAIDHLIDMHAHELR